MIKKCKGYFTKGEILLWAVSAILIVASNIIAKNGALSIVASLIGVTSLIFNAKANPIGQLLMIAFSLFYGYISFSFAYYGEMLTYVGMSMPMALLSLFSWLKNPHNGKKSEVEINEKISVSEHIFMWCLTAFVTALFYFILKFFNTANIVPSTISITTSFAAVYFTFRRSPLFAFFYALNDIVLIVLWILASFDDISYLSMVVCFTAFLANDIYTFISWRKISYRQKND